MKLTEYPAATRFDSGDILIKDGTNGTKRITAADAAVEFAGLVSAINHRNVYRGKNLGMTITQAQKTAIQNGTFDDLFIGDYWTINSRVYRIADMDYWYNSDNTVFAKHHLVMVPDASMFSAKMNDENVTTGGYVLSKMYTEYLEPARTTIATDFGELLQSHRQIFTNAVTAGYPSGYAWVDSTVDLMNEINVYGCKIYSPMGNGTIVPVQYTIDKSQFALFALNHTMINPGRYWYWLRDVVSASVFARVGSIGGAAYDYASASGGVRPCFAIG